MSIRPSVAVPTAEDRPIRDCSTIAFLNDSRISVENRLRKAIRKNLQLTTELVREARRQYEAGQLERPDLKYHLPLNFHDPCMVPVAGKTDWEYNPAYPREWPRPAQKTAFGAQREYRKFIRSRKKAQRRRFLKMIYRKAGGAFTEFALRRKRNDILAFKRFIENYKFPLPPRQIVIDPVRHYNTDVPCPEEIEPEHRPVIYTIIEPRKKFGGIQFKKRDTIVKEKFKMYGALRKRAPIAAKRPSIWDSYSFQYTLIEDRAYLERERRKIAEVVTEKRNPFLLFNDSEREYQTVTELHVEWFRKAGVEEDSETNQLARLVMEDRNRISKYDRLTFQTDAGVDLKPCIKDLFSSDMSLEDIRQVKECIDDMINLTVCQELIPKVVTVETITDYSGEERHCLRYLRPRNELHIMFQLAYVLVKHESTHLQEITAPMFAVVQTSKFYWTIPLRPFLTMFARNREVRFDAIQFRKFSSEVASKQPLAVFKMFLMTNMDKSGKATRKHANPDYIEFHSAREIRELYKEEFRKIETKLRRQESVNSYYSMVAEADLDNPFYPQYRQRDCTKRHWTEIAKRTYTFHIKPIGNRFVWRRAPLNLKQIQSVEQEREEIMRRMKRDRDYEQNRQTNNSQCKIALPTKLSEIVKFEIEHDLNLIVIKRSPMKEQRSLAKYILFRLNELEKTDFSFPEQKEAERNRLLALVGQEKLEALRNSLTAYVPKSPPKKGFLELQDERKISKKCCEVEDYWREMLKQKLGSLFIPRYERQKREAKCLDDKGAGSSGTRNCSVLHLPVWDHKHFEGLKKVNILGSDQYPISSAHGQKTYRYERLCDEVSYKLKQWMWVKDTLEKHAPYLEQCKINKEKREKEWREMKAAQMEQRESKEREMELREPEELEQWKRNEHLEREHRERELKLRKQDQTLQRHIREKEIEESLERDRQEEEHSLTQEHRERNENRCVESPTREEDFYRELQEREREIPIAEDDSVCTDLYFDSEEPEIVEALAGMGSSSYEDFESREMTHIFEDEHLENQKWRPPTPREEEDKRKSCSVELTEEEEIEVMRRAREEYALLNPGCALPYEPINRFDLTAPALLARRARESNAITAEERKGVDEDPTEKLDSIRYIPDEVEIPNNPIEKCYSGERDEEEMSIGNVSAPKRARHCSNKLNAPLKELKSPDATELTAQEKAERLRKELAAIRDLEDAVFEIDSDNGSVRTVSTKEYLTERRNSAPDEEFSQNNRIESDNRCRTRKPTKYLKELSQTVEHRVSVGNIDEDDFDFDRASVHRSFDDDCISDLDPKDKTDDPDEDNSGEMVQAHQKSFSDCITSSVVSVDLARNDLIESENTEFAKIKDAEPGQIGDVSQPSPMSNSSVLTALEITYSGRSSQSISSLLLDDSQQERFGNVSPAFEDLFQNSREASTWPARKESKTINFEQRKEEVVAIECVEGDLQVLDEQLYLKDSSPSTSTARSPSILTIDTLPTRRLPGSEPTNAMAQRLFTEEELLGNLVSLDELMEKNGKRKAPENVEGSDPQVSDDFVPPPEIQEPPKKRKRGGRPRKDVLKTTLKTRIQPRRGQKNLSDGNVEESGNSVPELMRNSEQQFREEREKESTIDRELLANALGPLIRNDITCFLNEPEPVQDHSFDGINVPVPIDSKPPSIALSDDDIQVLIGNDGTSARPMHLDECVNNGKPQNSDYQYSVKELLGEYGQLEEMDMSHVTGLQVTIPDCAEHNIIGAEVVDPPLKRRRGRPKKKMFPKQLKKMKQQESEMSSHGHPSPQLEDVDNVEGSISQITCSSRKRHRPLSGTEVKETFEEPEVIQESSSATLEEAQKSGSNGTVAEEAEEVEDAGEAEASSIPPSHKKRRLVPTKNVLEGDPKERKDSTTAENPEIIPKRASRKRNRETIDTTAMVSVRPARNKRLFLSKNNPVPRIRRLSPANSASSTSVRLTGVATTTDSAGGTPENLKQLPEVVRKMVEMDLIESEGFESDGDRAAQIGDPGEDGAETVIKTEAVDEENWVPPAPITETSRKSRKQLRAETKQQILDEIKTEINGVAPSKDPDCEVLMEMIKIKQEVEAELEECRIVQANFKCGISPAEEDETLPPKIIAEPGTVKQLHKYLFSRKIWKGVNKIFMTDPDKFSKLVLTLSTDSEKIGRTFKFNATVVKRTGEFDQKFIEFLANSPKALCGDLEKLMDYSKFSCALREKASLHLSGHKITPFSLHKIIEKIPEIKKSIREGCPNGLVGEAEREILNAAEHILLGRYIESVLKMTGLSQVYWATEGHVKRRLEMLYHGWKMFLCSGGFFRVLLALNRDDIRPMSEDFRSYCESYFVDIQDNYAKAVEMFLLDEDGILDKISMSTGISKEDIELLDEDMQDHITETHTHKCSRCFCKDQMTFFSTYELLEKHEKLHEADLQECEKCYNEYPLMHLVFHRINRHYSLRLHDDY